MRRPKVPISAELIQRCPEPTLYEKELLSLRFVNKKSVSEIAVHFHKVAGTISPQINTAIEKYEAWYRSAGNEVSKIMEREEVVADEQLRTLRQKIKEEKKTIAEKKEKIKAKRELREQEKIRLRYEAIENPAKLIDYVLKYVLEDANDLVMDIEKYFPRKNLEEVVKDAFKNSTLDSELVADEDNAFQFCRRMLEKKVRPVKHQALFKKYNWTLVRPRCPEKQKGDECRRILEYDPNHPADLSCPNHSSDYDPGRRSYRCPVCETMGYEDSSGEGFKLEYQARLNIFKCRHCGCERPVDVERLESIGTEKGRWEAATGLRIVKIGALPISKYGDPE